MFDFKTLPHLILLHLSHLYPLPLSLIYYFEILNAFINFHFQSFDTFFKNMPHFYLKYNSFSPKILCMFSIKKTGLYLHSKWKSITSINSIESIFLLFLTVAYFGLKIVLLFKGNKHFLLNIFFTQWFS